MLLARDTGNRIPFDPDYVRRAAYLEQEPNFERLIALGFVEMFKRLESGVFK